jgi:iron(III) transport system substrate-binding protein
MVVTRQATTAKKLRYLALFSGASLTLISCGSSAPDEVAPAAAEAASQDEVCEQARAEGEVSLWGPINPPFVEALAKDFNATYPGIEVTSSEITAGELVPKVISLAQANQPSADIVQSSLSILQPLTERDLLESYSDWSDFFDIPEDSILLDGSALAWYNNTTPIAYNTDLVSPDEVPQDWEDLLDPKWKGKILVEERGKAFSAMGQVDGEDAMLRYLEQLMENEPRPVKGGTTVLQQLASGVGAIGLGAYGYDITNYKDKEQAPVDWVAADPIGASQFVVSVVKDAAHPAAARCFAGWLASADGLESHLEITGRGSVLPGSNTDEAKRVADAGAELVVESASNAAKVADLEKKAGAVITGQGG